MIKEFDFQNFKPWANSGKIRLAPLTVFCGTNSSGKSSISQFLLMLKQTVESYDRRKILHFGDSSSLVDLGTYEEVIHKRDVSRKLSFGFEIDTEPIKIIDSVHKKDKGTYSDISFHADIGYNPENAKLSLDKLNYKLNGSEILEFGLTSTKGRKYQLTSQNYEVVRRSGRVWELPPPENFFGFPPEATAYFQNTGFLQDLSLAMTNFFKSLYYVGPLRNYPERLYQFSGEVPAHVEADGTLAINCILAARDRKISRGFKKMAESFEAVIARWLKTMGLIYSFEIKAIGAGRKEFEVKIKVNKKSTEVLITDVGFGISQVLPVVVQCFYVASKSILFFEQPEIHLHPSVQSHLGDLFIEALQSRENNTDRGLQIIVESHSEHLIRRIQRRIAENVIRPSDVAIYFISQNNGEAELTPLNIDMFGNITNWPKDFFGDDIEDLAAVARATIDRKMAQKSAN
jgi:predicted ATPase